MAAPVGTVLYNKNDESYDSEMWDDSALIKAYDNAVRIMKDEMAGKKSGKKDAALERGEESGSQNVLAGLRQKEGRKRRKKNKQKKNKLKVGDKCRAVYSGDGQLYDAVIVEMDSANHFCKVHFIGYDEEEEQSLGDVLPWKSQKHHHHNEINNELEHDSEMSVESSPAMPRRSPSASHDRSYRQRGSTRTGVFVQPAPPVFPLPPPVPPAVPAWPWTVGGGPSMPMIPPFPVGQSSFNMPRLPVVPPPPPPRTADVEDDCVDDSALSSMLISWYMSGYHTGYYQGQRDTLKQSTSQRPSRMKKSVPEKWQEQKRNVKSEQDVESLFDQQDNLKTEDVHE